MLILFIAITLFLIFLPLMPGIIELISASDVEPLRVTQDYDNNTQYFAMGLRSYLEKNFSSFFAGPAPADAKFQEGKLRDGTYFQIAGSDERPHFSKKELDRKSVGRLLISAHPLMLPAGTLYEKEVYSSSSVKAEPGSQFRALMSEGDMELGPDTTILRWVHSNASLYVGHNSTLYGRASAEDTIHIKGNSYFERLSAKKIMFGQTAPMPPQLYRSDQQTKVTTLPGVKEQFGRHWLIEGNIHLAENSFFDGDMVATKSIQIEQGCHITGSLKSNKDMYISAGTRIEGSLVSTGFIHIEHDCQIMGPIISENVIFIENNVTIGSSELPTTVSAPLINIIGSVVVFGSVRVDVEGRSILETNNRAELPKVNAA